MNNPPCPCQACGSVVEKSAWASLFFLTLTIAGGWGLWKMVKYLDKD